jgi:excisionase family DNA binding protein
MTHEHQRTVPRLHLIDEVAAILGVSTRTVRRLIAAEELMACRLGRSVREQPRDLAREGNRQRGQ